MRGRLALVFWCDVCSCTEGEENAKDKCNHDKAEDGQRGQAPSRPLDLRPPHRCDQLLALQRGFRCLPILGCGQWGEEDEGTRYPEKGEH